MKDRYDAGFIAGVAYAAAILIKAFDQPTFAKELLEQAGYTLDDLRRVGVAEYDLDVLVNQFEAHSR